MCVCVCGGSVAPDDDDEMTMMREESGKGQSGEICRYVD